MPNFSKRLNGPRRRRPGLVSRRGDRFGHRHPLRIGPFLFLFIGFAPVVAAAIKHAENFEIEQGENHRIVRVHHSSGDPTLAHQYLLVPRGTAVPAFTGEATVIRTPVRRVVAMETVYLGFMEELGILDTLVGAGTVDHISNSRIRTKIAGGHIAGIQTGQTVDIEKLLLLQPDLILTSVSADAGFDMPAKLRRSQLPVVLTSGYLEKTALARAEWIKFIAAFFEEDEAAATIFDQVESRYQALAESAATSKHRPTILSGAPFSGVWHVPGGRSFMAQMIRDAGGDYLWSENESERSIPLDTERVFLKAGKADIWINPSGYRSMEALLAADRRFGKFEAARRGSVFNNTRQVGPRGGNAVWESGVVRPDEVLKDLISIFHPQLLKDHQLIFYERLN